MTNDAIGTRGSGRGEGAAAGVIAMGRPGAPWFVQFWPVFIACLMAASIAASLATVVIAYRHADEDVRPGHGRFPIAGEGEQAPGAEAGREAGVSPR